MTNPKSLFKYIGFDKSLDVVAAIINGIFVDSKLKIRTPRYFNDRFDSRVILNKKSITEIINKVDRIIPHNHNLTEERIKLFTLQLEAQPILCLTEMCPANFESDIMWGLYGGNGNGICLEFDFAKINDINYNGLNLGSSFKVIYDDTVSKYDNFVKIIFSKMCGEVLRSRGYPSSVVQFEFANAMKRFHLTKGCQWSHEKEYRLIHSFPLINACTNETVEKSVIMERQAQKDDYYIPITTHPELFKLTTVYGSNRNEFTELHLPIPKAIYLGFSHSDGKHINLLSKQLSKIKNFAKLNQIPIFQLTGEVDYIKKKFAYKKIG